VSDPSEAGADGPGGSAATGEGGEGGEAGQAHPVHPAIGRRMEIRDSLDPARAVALHALLGMPGRPPAAGDALIPFGHHVYFWEVLPPWSLDVDGHAAPGSGFVPDLGLRIRSWVGSAVFWHAPLRLGVEAVRHSEIAEIRQTAGRSGVLGFVAVDHRIEQAGSAVLTERQTLLCRSAPPAGSAAAPQPAAPGTAETAIEDPAFFDPVALFRYAALGFDAHRIHYDADFARSEQGQVERVVPTPMIAQRLALMATARLGPLMRFSFHAATPLCLGEEASFCAAKRDGPRLRLWLRGPEGRLCMSAEAEALKDRD
jgi:3-methylfumaryl-CoA hydratase